MDLSAILGAEAAAQVRTSLEQLGLGGQLGGLSERRRRLRRRSAPAVGRPSRAAQSLPYTSTPGEVTSSGSKALMWFAALLAIGLIGVVAYLVLAG